MTILAWFSSNRHFWASTEGTHLVYGGQVAVGVGEGRVDLNSPGVALECALYVLHLLQCVPHVGVGISKGRRNPVGKESTLSLRQTTLFCCN